MYSRGVRLCPKEVPWVSTAFCGVPSKPWWDSIEARDSSRRKSWDSTNGPLRELGSPLEDHLVSDRSSSGSPGVPLEDPTPPVAIQ